VDIFGFFGTILTPIKWVIEAILVGFHWVFSNVFHMDPAAGFTWVLSIVCLVLVVRAALIPIFVRQIKSQRKMMEVAPQLKKIQDKYKGKKDQFSREAMQRETMELYRKAGTNPLSSCLPHSLHLVIAIGRSAAASFCAASCLATKSAVVCWRRSADTKSTTASVGIPQARAVHLAQPLLSANRRLAVLLDGFAAELRAAAPVATLPRVPLP